MCVVAQWVKKCLFVCPSGRWIVSARSKVVLVIILIVFSITAENFVSNWFFTRQRLLETTKKWQTQDCDLANNLISAQISLLKSNATTVAERLLNTWSKDEMIDMMMAQCKEFPDFTAFSVFTIDGVLVSFDENFNDSPFLVTFLENSSYLEAAFNGASVLFAARNESNTLVFCVCVPMGRDHVLAVTIRGSFFQDIVFEYELWQTGNIFILDEHGMIIADRNMNCICEPRNYVELAKTNPAMRSIGEFFEKVISTEEGMGTYELHDVEQICSYKRISAPDMGWVVGVVAPLQESPVPDIRIGLFFSFLLFLTIGGIVVFLTRFVIKTHRKIAEQNDQLEDLSDIIKTRTVKILEEHERMKILLDSMPLAAQLWNRNNEIIECNEEVVKIFKTKNKQEYIDRFFEFSPKYQPNGQLSADSVIANVKKAFENDRYVFEWTHQTSDRILIPTEITFVRIKLEDDYVVASYTRDLREYKQVMMEIERRDYLLNMTNRAAALLLQSEPDVFESDLNHCMGMLAEAIDIDRIYICKNHTVGGELYCTQLYEWSGNVEPHQGSDLTVNISYSRKIPGWEETLSRGNCINRLVSDMSPVEQSQLLPQGIKSIFVMPIFFQDQFWGFIGYDDCHRERIFSANDQLILRTGGLVITSAVLRNEMTLSIRDVASQLEEALNEAQKANHAKTNFLARMSHEIRTPLNAVIGLSELTMKNDIDDEVRISLEKIHNAGGTILSTVNDILDISKIEAGKFELIPSEYDVSSLINDAVTQNILRIGDKPIEFILEVDEHLPTHLFGDELKIKQILSNLLSNAFKYTREGIVKLNISGEREDDTLWLTARVQDTGIGIHPDDLGQLFSAYVQVNPKSNRHVEGTGLGLVLAQKMAEMMNGTITAESVYGQGSVFTARLQQAIVTEAAIGLTVAKNLQTFRYSDSKRDQNNQLVRTPMPYARVLVVDDIITNLDVVKGQLQAYKIHVHCVTNGPQAVSLIRDAKVKFDAIFMDHMMAEMDGIEATRIIRQIDTDYARNIPIIALTANAIIGNEEMFLNNGFQAFLSKPVDIARLDEVIQRWIRDRSQEELLADLEERQTPVFNHCRRGEENRERRRGYDRRMCNWKITGLNIRQGIEQFGGEEFYQNVLRSFARNTVPLLEIIKDVDKNNLADYATVVHGLKGSCRAICAEIVGDVAKLLENAALEGNFALIMDYNATFVKTIHNLINEIENLLQSRARENPRPQKDKIDIEILSKLLEACESYDMDEVDAAMETLEEYEYSTDEELVVWLRENVDRMNFTQIRERLLDAIAEKAT